MREFVCLMKKEWLETVRSGKLAVLFILFLLFGIMNPAIAKLTPWMMETLADSLAETGLTVAEVHVDACTSWAQFFKNIPIGLISFVLIYSSIFTTEYQSGTLVLVLTKGVSRFKVVLAKAGLMLLMWSACYWLSFAVTYLYNDYFWDNDIARNLPAAVCRWWLFGIWVISLLVLYSAAFKRNAGVLLGTGGTVMISYIVGCFPRAHEFMPSRLMEAAALLNGGVGADTCIKAVIVTIFLCIAAVAVSISIMNNSHL